MTDRLSELDAKLRNGEIFTYEDAADLFELTTMGQHIMNFNGLDRAAIVELLRRRLPTPEKLTEALLGILLMIDSTHHTRQ